MTRGLAVAAALATTSLAACTVYDGRSELRLVALSEPTVTEPSGSLALRVDGSKGTRPRLEIDGASVGDVPVHQPFALTFGDRADGTHVLVAVAYEGELLRRSSPLTVVVDTHAPVITATPPPGVIVVPGPFTVDLASDEPLDPASLDLSAIGLVVPAAVPPVATTASISPDLRHLRITSTTVLADVSGLALTGEVADRFGHRTALSGEWTAPALGAWIHQYGRSGVVTLDVSWSGGPATAQVLVDGVLVGGVARGATLSWDSRGFADGVHALTVRAPGYVPTLEEVTSLNERPTILSCAPALPPPNDADFAAGIAVTFSAPVCPPAVPFGCALPRSDHALVHPVRPSTFPARVVPSFDGWLDAEGNAVVPSSACAVDYPDGFAPWGDGPLDVFGAARMAFLYAGRSTAGQLLIWALRERDGGLARLDTVAGDPWSVRSDVAYQAAPGNVASQLTGWTWVETTPGGQATLRRSPDALTGEDFAPLAASSAPHVLQRSTWPTEPLWIETAPGGQRVVPLLGLAPAPGLDVVEAGGDLTPWYGKLVAVVEAGPGVAGRLRAFGSGLSATPGWQQLGGGLNADPARAASEPCADVVNGDYLAWVEGGDVWIRNLVGDVFGPAHRVAPGARSPRAIESFLLVLVPGTTSGQGDRFDLWTHELLPDAWTRYATLDTGGRVTSFEAAYPAIVWTDDAGATRIRFVN